MCFLIIFFLPAAQAQAADFFLELKNENTKFDLGGYPEPKIVVGMRGEIVEGDAERLKALMAELSGGERTLLYGQGLSMDSPGGSLDAAIALANVIWDMNMTTYVYAGKRCLSGCAVAFMAGRRAETDVFSAPRRFMHPSAKLGFHAPFALANTSDIPPEVAKLLLLDAERGGSLAASKLVKLSVGGILSSSLVEALLQYDKDSFLYIDTVDRAGRWQIGLIGEEPLKSPSGILRPEDVASMEMHCNNLLYWIQDVASEDRKGTSKFHLGTLIFDGLDHSCKYGEGVDGGYSYNVDSVRGGTVLYWQTLPPETVLAILTPETLNGDNPSQDPFANPPQREVAGSCHEGYKWVGGWAGTDYRNSGAFTALRECVSDADIFRIECRHGEQQLTALLLVAPFTSQASDRSVVEFQIDEGLRIQLSGSMKISPGIVPYFTFQIPREAWTLKELAKGNRATFWVDNRGGSMHLAGTAQAVDAMQKACL